MAQFTNRATLRLGDTVINSNVAVGEIAEPLSVTKQATDTSYTVGERISYVISLRNTGTQVLPGITVVDDLGAYTGGDERYVPLDYIDGSLLYYVNGVITPAPDVNAGPPLTVSGIDIPALGNVMIVYSARVNEYAPLDSGASVTNTVTADGDGLVEPITAEQTLAVAQTPQLSITKSISPIPVTDNGRVVYTITITNSGNTPVDATDDLILTDIFDPVLTDLAVSYNGSAWTEGTNYTYDRTTGLFTTLGGQISVDAAQYSTDPDTGAVIINPSVSTVTISGTI